MVIVLGLLAILLGTTLPNGIDRYMESIVGVTLILLAIWVFWSLIHNRENFRMQSRWMLLFRTFRRTYHWLEKRIAGHVHDDHQHHQPESEGYGVGTAYGIGMLHGIGAETGTQVLLFATAAGATSDISASVLLVAFVVGLVVSNSLIALASITGLWGKRANSIAYQAVGVIVGLFSLTLGILFLAQRGEVLPAILS
jgi:high-affinity nickel-transport protein